MHARRLQSESGQTAAELALLLGGIAMACIVALMSLGGGIGGLFDSNGRQLAGVGHASPAVVPSEPLVYPTTLDECVDPGWHAFPQFETEEECVGYVESL